MAHTTTLKKAYNANTGTANTFSYSGSFDVFKGSEVIVELDSTALTYQSGTINESASPRQYTVDTTAKTIHVGGADLSSGTLKIYPSTDLGSPTPRSTFSAGSSVTASDINANQTQVLRKLMEIDETAVTTTTTPVFQQSISFEGATDDAYETTLSVTDPTADRTITLPNTTGTVPVLAVHSDTAITSTPAELNYSDGVTSNIQTQLDAKQTLDAELTELATMGSGTASALADLTQTEVQILDGATVSTTELNYVDNVSSAIQTQLDAKQAADAELTELATMGSTTASALADLTQAEVQILDGATVTTAELNKLDGYTGTVDDLNELNGLDKETTITDDDAKFPTSGAVVDYVAAQIAPIGGLEVIATDAAFPNDQPASGVVISIADAGGLVVNGSGQTTTGRTVGGSTVTINNINSSFHSDTIDNGIGMLVTSTGAGQIYNYHKTIIKEADVAQISDDINDFNSRYRIAGSAPGSDNDEGDLYFDTGTNKMYVYDGSSWGEVTSTGDFKYLTLCAFNTGTGNAAVFNGSLSKYDLRENSTSGSLASVTSAAQLMVSVNGVIQKPNTGTSIGSNDGFCMVDGHTIEFGANIPSSSEVFAIQSGSALSITTPGDNTVTGAKIALGSDAAGDIMYYNGTDYVRLGKGTNGHYLKQGSSNAPEWAAVPAGVGGAAGVDFDDAVKVRFGTGNDLVLESDGTVGLVQAATILQLGISADADQVNFDSTGIELNTATRLGAGDHLTVRDSSEIRFTEATANGNAYVGIKSPTDKGSDASYTITLPSAAPASNGLALTATTAGVASWTSVSSTTANGCIYENDQTISNDYTIASGKGAHSVGPITVNATVTVNGNWVVS